MPATRLSTLLCAGLLTLALPGRAALQDFSGTLAVTERSGSSIVPLFSGNGVGMADSTRNATTNAVSSFQSVTGFTGSGEETNFFLTLILEFTSLGPGSFQGTAGGMLGGSLGVRGAFHARTMTAGPTNQVLPLTVSGTRGLGLGGTIMGGGATHVFNDWTTGTVTLMGVGLPGTSSVGTITVAGYDDRTASGAGAVQFVSPTRVVQSGEDDTFYTTRLTLEFAPEPGRGLGLGLGAAVALALALRRKRSLRA